MGENTTDPHATTVAHLQTPVSQPSPLPESVGYDELHNAHDLLREYVASGPEQVYSTGILSLDRALLGGFRKKALYVIAGRPGQAKSSLALSISRRMAMTTDVSTLYLSLEMTKHELIERLICQATLTPLPLLERMKATPQHLQQATHQLTKRLERVSLHIEDLRGATIDELDSLWQELQEGERKPELLVIDHLQQIPMAHGVNRADALSTYMADLKHFVKQKNVIGLICCQINRPGDDKPGLTNLKGSGGIEENADVVLICSRKKVEGVLTMDDHSADCEYQILIAKHRRGPEATITLTFRPPCFEFLEPSAYGTLKHPALETQLLEDDDAVTL